MYVLQNFTVGLLVMMFYLLGSKMKNIISLIFSKDFIEWQLYLYSHLHCGRLNPHRTADHRRYLKYISSVYCIRTYQLT